MQIEPSTELSPEVARARLPELEASLASRKSTVHFARSGVSLVACIIFTAAAAKLFWDSIRFPILGAVAVLIAVGLVVYAWAQYRRGRVHLHQELELFARLQAVHRVLHLDDPSALLPR